jgi:O-Antigen ligase
MSPAVQAFEPGRIQTVSAPHRQERLYRCTVALIGLATPIQFEMMGILYVPEILLACVALWALVGGLGNPAFWRRPFVTMLACLAVTMAAYMVADLSLGTEPSNLLRGWARIVFLGSNFVGLYFLCRREPLSIVVYSVASAVGALGYLWWSGRLLEDWKFGASAPVTVLAASLAPILAPRGALAGSVALAAIGVAHILLDSREIGGNCLLAGVLLLARCSSVLRMKSFSYAVLGALTIGGIGALLYAYVLTDETYGQRRQLSNAWRTASLVTAVDGILESPWIGNGSQANNFELQSRYDSIFAERTGARYHGARTDTSTFSPHSQILQSWFEAGIFGTVFFLYLGWRLLRAVHICIFRRELDALSVLFAYCLLRATWHLFFSPFAGLARMDIAVAAVIVCVLAAEHRTPAEFAA